MIEIETEMVAEWLHNSELYTTIKNCRDTKISIPHQYYRKNDRIITWVDFEEVFKISMFWNAPFSPSLLHYGNTHKQECGEYLTANCFECSHVIGRFMEQVSSLDDFCAVVKYHDQYKFKLSNSFFGFIIQNPKEVLDGMIQQTIPMTYIDYIPPIYRFFASKNENTIAVRVCLGLLKLSRPNSEVSLKILFCL